MNSPSSSPARATWTARPASASPEKVSQLTPARVDGQWTPLVQHWVKGGTEPAFQPGWARISWNQDSLVYDIVLTGAGARNSATRTNELTYDLGDVCEVFVEAQGGNHYLELHITPENQRLQLHWPLGGLDKVRAKQAKLDEFMVSNPDWVRTTTQVGSDYWAAQAVVPAALLGLPGNTLTAKTGLNTAVCRYDYTAQKKPTLSSTAAFQELFFHRRAEWHNLVLLPS